MAHRTTDDLCVVTIQTLKANFFFFFFLLFFSLQIVWKLVECRRGIGAVPKKFSLWVYTVTQNPQLKQ